MKWMSFPPEVRSRLVIPAQAGIQVCFSAPISLDPRFRGYDGLLAILRDSGLLILEIERATVFSKEHKGYRIKEEESLNAKLVLSEAKELGLTQRAQSKSLHLVIRYLSPPVITTKPTNRDEIL